VLSEPAGAAASARTRLAEVLCQHGGRLVVALFALVSIAIALFSLHMDRVSQDRREAEKWHIHTLEVLLTAEDLRISTFDLLRGERGYLLTSNEDFLRPYNRGRVEAARHVAHLRELTRDNPDQLRQLDTIAERMREFVALLNDTVELARRGDQAAALGIVRAGHGRRSFDQLRESIDRFEAEERRLLIVRRERLQGTEAAADQLTLAAGITNVILFAIAAFAALVAIRAQLRARQAVEDLRRLATVDELTGLPNRRHFMARLEEELARARRNNSPLCLATLDIDHFKPINDTHGHAAGDAVLRQLATVIREKIRLGDSAARLGGEEFALLLPNTNAHQARLVCDRLRGAVADRDFDIGGTAIGVTLSTGVALLHKEDDSVALMRRSDEALYQAKAGGRNQVHLAA